MSVRDTCVIVLVLSAFVVGQEKPTTDDNVQMNKLRAVIDRSAEVFQLSPLRDPAAKMSSKAVLRWANHERDSESVGVVSLWIDQGQPVAAMATYNWMDRIHHEFDLLARSPVIGRQDGTTVWQPKSGRKFQSIPDAPIVEMNESSRLRQMKELAGQFEATMLGWRADNSDRAELRRLPRQLYRYEPKSTEVIDGAVFAFVLGNDPEALLLIEAIKQKEQPEWQYAFVRQTSGGLEGRHKNLVVWSVEKHGLRNDPTATGLSIASRVNLKAELDK